MNKYITERDWYSVDNSIINDFARKVVGMFKEQCPAVTDRDYICWSGKPIGTALVTVCT